MGSGVAVAVGAANEVGVGTGLGVGVAAVIVTVVGGVGDVRNEVGRGGLVCLNSAARFDKWNRAAVR